MHRMKVGLVAAAVLLVFTAGVHSIITRDLKGGVVKGVEADVSRAQRMHQSITRLEALDFSNLVVGLSRHPGIAAALDKTEETPRRQAAFEQCEAINASLQKGARKADIVAVLDASGKVVARDLNVN